MNFHVLKAYGGIKYLVFDKDNTLTIPYERNLHPSIESQLITLKGLYGPQNIAILSNSVGSKEDKGHSEAEILEKLHGIKVIRHLKKKPDVN